MGLDDDIDVEITGATTPSPVLSFAGKPQPRTRVDTRWNLDLDRSLLFYAAVAVALLAGIGNDASLASALATVKNP